jgi:DNA repair protein RadD
LDYGGNVLRHGPVDAIQADGKIAGNGEPPAKECPTCHSVIAAGYAVCPDCGHVFPPREKNKHGQTASDAGILKGQVTLRTYDVQEVAYSVHTKRGAGPEAPRSLRVDYRLGLNHWQSEWICVEHSGFARQKAESWWIARADVPVPNSAAEACELACAGSLREPAAITIRSVAGEDFDRIVGYQWPEIATSQPEPDYVPANDEIPF